MRQKEKNTETETEAEEKQWRRRLHRRSNRETFPLLYPPVPPPFYLLFVLFCSFALAVLLSRCRGCDWWECGSLVVVVALHFSCRPPLLFSSSSTTTTTNSNRYSSTHTVGLPPQLATTGLALLSHSALTISRAPALLALAQALTHSPLFLRSLTPSSLVRGSRSFVHSQPPPPPPPPPPPQQQPRIIWHSASHSWLSTHPSLDDKGSASAGRPLNAAPTTRPARRGCE